MSVPAVEPGTSVALKLPPIAPSYDVLEGQVERSRRRLSVAIDGEPAREPPVECWLLPHNEWSTLPEHRPALATFVLPNHPTIAALASDVTLAAGPDASAETLLGALFEILAIRWHLAYRLEPPHWSKDSQKVRLPHQILHDDAGRRGEGTCLDLVLRRPFAAAKTEAEEYFVEQAMIFALDVAAARRDEIMPLPFAGLPSWSAGVRRAIEAAQAHARTVSGQLCPAALLAGLLTAGDGLTSDLVGASLGDPASVARTVVATLPPSPPAPAASPGYRQVADLAQSRAKAEGSPRVLEVHLLGALLSMRSSSLDRALGRLGTDQQQLARALRTASGTDLLGSTSSNWR